jgi:CRP/FNR family cyclic AMP-dependent transcriptional regulator
MLKKVPLFESLSPDDLKELERGMHTQSFAKGSVLVTQGEASNNLLYIVLSGKLKVFMSNAEGREILLDFLTEGAAFGELSLFDDEPRSATVMTVEDSKIGLFPRAYFFQCLHNNPNIAIELLKTVIKRMRSTTEQVSSLALLDIYGRIAKTLTSLAKTDANGRSVTDAITHQELASMVGSSREMVTRILNDLKRGGYIVIDNHCVEIKNRLPHRW